MKALGSVLVACAAACLSCQGEVICHGTGCATGDSTMEVIYEDAPAPHWQTIAGWNSCQIEEKAVTGEAGATTTAIHATADGDYAGFWLARTDAPRWQGNYYWASIGDYRAFRARIFFADAAAIPDVQVCLGNSTSAIGSDLPVTTYLPASPVANRWYEIVVPMADFQASSAQTFISVGFQFGANRVDLNVDDVRLELATGSDSEAMGLAPVGAGAERSPAE
jgi:hypothetical protein